MKFISGNAEQLYKFAKYVAVGLSAAAVDFGVFIVLFNVGVALPLANGLALAAGFLWSFVLNKIWAFQSGSAPFMQLLLTLLLLLFNIVVSSFLIVVLIERLGMAPAWAKILMQAVVVLWNFIIYNHVIFKK